MEKPFEDVFYVHSHDTDMNAVMSIQNIVKYYMETAIDHSESVGYTFEWLAKEQRGWVVLNWFIKMYEYPKFTDNIKISTWAKKGNSLQATRYFTMEDENGKVYSEAASRWAFLDLAKRHPTRFTEEMYEVNTCDKEAPFDPGNFALPKEKEEMLVSEKNIEIRRSETDTNGHVNNVCYVQWACDNIPDDIYSGYMAEEIRVLYRKECRYGDNVTVKTYITDYDDNKKQTISSVNDVNGKPLCKIALVWHRKN